MWYLKHHISARAATGIILSFIGIVYVYFADSRSLYDTIGGLFGVSAGLTLAIITVITAYLVKKDPLLRIYQSMLGASLFFLVTTGSLLAISSLITNRPKMRSIFRI